MTSRSSPQIKPKGGVSMVNSNDGGGTGRKPASNAGKLLRDPKTPKKVKDVAASDLAQAPRKPKKNGQ